jgi:acetyl esterase/lipase
MKKCKNQSPFPLILLLLITISFSAQAQTQVIKIWPDLAPGSENKENKEQWNEGKSVSNVYQPDLTVFLPEHHAEPMPAIIIFPGGGYRNVVMEKEGYKIARWLNENGIAAFVLKYRLEFDEALHDAQRAVRVVRNSAGEYGLDRNKIGVIGFSAGAHLAGNLCINNRAYDRYDDIDTVSSRPDFWIGVYGSYGNIVGSGNRLSGSKFEARENIPPTFLVHAGNDSKVSALESVELYKYLRGKGIPAELHVYEQGEHGFALQKDMGPDVTSTVDAWSGRLLEWLKVRGIL